MKIPISYFMQPCTLKFVLLAHPTGKVCIGLHTILVYACCLSVCTYIPQIHHCCLYVHTTNIPHHCCQYIHTTDLSSLLSVRMYYRYIITAVCAYIPSLRVITHIRLSLNCWPMKCLPATGV